MSRLQRLLEELKRRRVFRVAVVYAAVAFVVWQVAEIAVPGLNLPNVVLTTVILLTVLGFPVALALAWAFDITPEGVKRTESETAAVEGPAVPSVDAPAERKSIVVLPFDNMSPDPQDAYLSDGLTEEIITGLSCCGRLRVISRNSARVLKGTDKDTRTIARELDVQYVLEGSVRKAGNDLRITAQLIDGRTDEHLWSERYSGTLDDVFDMQERLSCSIVDALMLELSPEEERRLTERPIDNAQVYECSLRARHDQAFW
jgi:TolB-like protein